MKWIKVFSLIGMLMVTFMVKLPAQLGSKNTHYTHADTLRGSYGPGRDWWDVVKYDLHVKLSITDSMISGYNDITLRVLKKGKNLQLLLCCNAFANILQNAGSYSSSSWHGDALHIPLRIEGF